MRRRSVTAPTERRSTSGQRQKTSRHSTARSTHCAPSAHARALCHSASAGATHATWPPRVVAELASAPPAPPRVQNSVGGGSSRSRRASAPRGEHPAPLVAPARRENRKATHPGGRERAVRRGPLPDRPTDPRCRAETRARPRSPAHSGGVGQPRPARRRRLAGNHRSARRTELYVPRVESCHGRSSRSDLRAKHLPVLPAADGRAPCDDARVRWSGSPRRGARRLHVQRSRRGTTGRAMLRPIDRARQCHPNVSTLGGERPRARHTGGRATSARAMQPRACAPARSGAP
jgi:hypothetical protein